MIRLFVIEEFDMKNISEFVGKHFASLEANFVFRKGKQGNIDRKHNVSAIMFPSLPRA